MPDIRQYLIRFATSGFSKLLRKWNRLSLSTRVSLAIGGPSTELGAEGLALSKSVNIRVDTRYCCLRPPIDLAPEVQNPDMRARATGFSCACSAIGVVGPEADRRN